MNYNRHIAKTLSYVLKLTLVVAVSAHVFPLAVIAQFNSIVSFTVCDVTKCALIGISHKLAVALGLELVDANKVHLR